MGQPSEFVYEDLDALKKERIIFVAGGLGTAPVYPQVKWLHETALTQMLLSGQRQGSAYI